MDRRTLVTDLWAALRQPRRSMPTETYLATMPPTTVLVLLAVAQARQDKPGRLGVTIAQVAEYTGLAPSTVSNHLSSLVRRGWLHRHGTRPVVFRIGGGVGGMEWDS